MKLRRRSSAALQPRGHTHPPAHTIEAQKKERPRIAVSDPPISQEIWRFTRRDGANGYVERLPEEEGIEVMITKPMLDWQASLQLFKVPVREKRDYIVRFEAKADRVRRARIVSSINKPIRRSSLNELIDLGTEWGTYQIPFTARDTAETASGSLRCAE